jgi:RNA polymerase sigma factor (sigma-70 family)
MFDVNRRPPHRTGRPGRPPAGLLAAGFLAAAASPPLQSPMPSDPEVPSLETHLDDLEAVARRQDRAAFARLFAHFAPRVKAYLMRQGAEPGLAEDLAQETMLTVWRKAPGYDRRLAGPSTWIFTIARNRRIDALRRDRRGKLDPDDPALLPEADALPDTALEAGRWEKKLAAAIGGLPPEQAQMLKLAYFEDRSHGDIAQSLRLPLGTVKSRLRLAVARLRSIFETER